MSKNPSIITLRSDEQLDARLAALVDEVRAGSDPNASRSSVIRNILNEYLGIDGGAPVVSEVLHQTNIVVRAAVTRAVQEITVRLPEFIAEALAGEHVSEILPRMSDVDFGQLDAATAKQLIASYMPVVRALARVYPTHTRDDLVAVGRVAILEGYLSHEPDRSAQAWWIGRVVRWRLNAQAQREQRSNAGELHEEQLPAPPTQAVPSHLDLSALSANQRVVIQGRLADRTFRQIARNTGWSLRSVFRLYESACENYEKTRSCVEF